MQHLHHLACHRIQLVGAIQSDKGNSWTGGGDFNNGHATSCHDYCGVIATDDSLPLLKQTVSAFRIGSHDPSIDISADHLWRSTITPQGPATLHITGWHTDSPQIETFGDGAAWLSSRAGDLLGIHDHIPAIAPVHQQVAEAQKRFGQLRLGRSHTPYHELLHAVLAQRVTSIEAVRQWREIVETFGSPVTDAHPTLRTPPMPEVIASLPYHAFHRFGIERKRADTLITVAKHFEFLCRLSNETASPQHLTSQLQLIPGIGVWTAAVVGGLAFGDPDALLVGDFHVKNTVAFALSGRIRGTDEEMIEAMEPYKGQRHRVVRWLQLNGVRAPARGPRRRIVSITRL